MLTDKVACKAFDVTSAMLSDLGVTDALGLGNLSRQVCEKLVASLKDAPRKIAAALLNLRQETESTRNLAVEIVLREELEINL